jgi:hypothetical protein
VSSVLATHWARNQPPNVPQFVDPTPSEGPSEGPSSTALSLISVDPLSVKTRNKRNSIRVPTESNAKPDQLRYYASYTRWTELIENAKHLYHLHMSTVDAFPSTDNGYKEASECLHDIRRIFEQKQITLEDGMFIIHGI